MMVAECMWCAKVMQGRGGRQGAGRQRWQSRRRGETAARVRWGQQLGVCASVWAMALVIIGWRLGALVGISLGSWLQLWLVGNMVRDPGSRLGSWSWSWSWLRFRLLLWLRLWFSGGWLVSSWSWLGRWLWLG